MCRAYATPNETLNPYRDGGRFDIVKGKRYFRKMKEVTFDRGVNFTKFDCGDKEYRMDFFDIWFSSDVFMYKQDDVGLSGAVTRLTCARKPTEQGVHEKLRDLQFENVGVWDEFSDWREYWLASYRECAPEVVLTEEAREEWVHATHPKRKLREATHSKLADLQYWSHPTWIFDDSLGFDLGSVKYKMKPGELLPGGKYLRAVGDMTAPGAALGGYCMDYVKEAFTKPFELYGGKCTFVKKPEMPMLVSAFDKTINTECVEFTYFSDDSMIGVKCLDGTYYANLDISACDGSNFDPIFLLLKGVMREVCDPIVVDGIFAQCLSNCCIRNVWSEPRLCKEYFVLKPLYYTLYSGSVLTTSINNIANSCIFISFMRKFNKRKYYMSEIGGMLEEAAMEVGFLIKSQECQRIEQIQFLKTSPCIVAGEVRIFLNLAVRMRGFGSCKGDLPGSSSESLRERAKKYSNGVIKSFCHDGKHCITEAFRSRISGDSFEIKLDEWDVKLHGVGEYEIPIECLISRYSDPGYTATELDFLELADFIRNGIPGEGFNSALVQNIFSIDYGYPITNSDCELKPIMS